MEILIICSTRDNASILAGVRNANNGTEKGMFIIQDAASWQAYIEKPKQPKFVFIQPELDWGKSDLYGYQVAFLLLNEPRLKSAFDLRFISSIDYSVLRVNASTKHRAIQEAFKHYQALIDKFRISLKDDTTSALHFNLLRTLITKDIHRLSLVIHELLSLLSNVQDLEKELLYNDAILLADKELEELDSIEGVDPAITSQAGELLRKAENRESFGEQLNRLIRAVRLEHYRLLGAFSKEHNPVNKSQNKVIIIEDNPDWRKELAGIFGEYFEQVYPASEAEIKNFAMEDAVALIEAAVDTDIFILDLIYKRPDRSWLPFNGLDLYDLIKRRHPYAAVRIVSNLPRDMVAKWSRQVAFPVHFSQVFPKRDGYIGIRSVIQNRLLELTGECLALQQSKNAFKPIPNTGIFKWPVLRLMVYQLMTQNRALYLEKRQQARKLFDSYLRGELRIDSEGWSSGELMTQRAENFLTQDYVEKKLASIFAHRLLLIHMGLQHPFHLVPNGLYKDKVLKHTKTGGLDTNYFYRTGMFYQEYKADNIDEAGFIIHLKNMFPEEYEFIREFKQQEARDRDNKLLREFPQLQEWAFWIFARPLVYHNWALLGLDFTPYTTSPPKTGEQLLPYEQISRDLTIGQLAIYMERLIALYADDRVADMVMETISNDLDDNWKVPGDIRQLVEDLYQI